MKERKGKKRKEKKRKEKKRKEKKRKEKKKVLPIAHLASCCRPHLLL
jgi:hypothetical protein